MGRSIRVPISLCWALLAFPAAVAQTEATGEARVTPPEIILKTQKAPEYPKAALAARFSGTVTVEATVLKDGSVGSVEVVECTKPNLGFEQAAMDAVKQWRFEPATRVGEPLDYKMRFRLNFKGTGVGSVDPRVSAGTFTEAPSSGASSPAAATRTGER
jgi:TonB family protein